MTCPTQCLICRGPFHPATGHKWTETCALCLRCTLDWIDWLKRREAQMRAILKKKKQTTSFMEAALTSIKADC